MNGEELKTIGKVIREEITERTEPLADQVSELVEKHAELELNTGLRVEFLADEIKNQPPALDGADGTDGLDGTDGIDGEDGLDGADAPIIDPIESTDVDSLERGALVNYQGGLFQAIRKTNGGVGNDPLGYRPVVDGVADLAIDFDIDTCELSLAATFSSGRKATQNFRVPLIQHRGKHEPGSYLKNEMVTFNGAAYIAIKDTSETIPSDDWRCMVQRGKPGKAGSTGATGSTGVGIKEIVSEENTLLIEKTNGQIEVIKLPVVGDITPEDFSGAPLRQYKGAWRAGETYAIGDVVNYGEGIHVSTQGGNKELPTNILVWATLLTVNTVAGGSGAAGAWPPIVTSDMDMQNFHISNLREPRTGDPGKKDAVNREAMEAAIAAKALYQGSYSPATESPDLSALADTDFVEPITGEAVGKPDPAAGGAAPGSVIVWFEFKGVGFDSFPATLTAPLDFEVYLSDQIHERFQLPARTYNNIDALTLELDLHIAGTTVRLYEGYIHAGDTWIGVMTHYPEYALGILHQSGGGFPNYPPGPNNQILNAYNWVVTTSDPNTPEYAPAGIPGIAAGTVLHNSDILEFAANLGKFAILRGGSLTQQIADARYWRRDADNFQWQDEAYSIGAVVLDGGIFFQAIQAVPIGTTRPTLATAPDLFWRVISELATVFIGHHAWNQTLHDDSNNWGMPTETRPANMQPKTGDMYLNADSGEFVAFTATPAGVNLPDVITGVVAYGTRRDFQITMNGAADETRNLLNGIEDTDAIYHFVIKQRDSGSIYEFDYVITAGFIQLNPISVVSSQNHFKDFYASWSANSGHLNVTLGTGAGGVLYDVIVKSDTGNLGSLVMGDGNTTGATTAIMSRLDAELTYPDKELNDFLRGKAGDNRATIPAGGEVGDNLLGEVFSLESKTLHTIRGVFFDNAEDWQPYIRLQQAGATPLDYANFHHLFGTSVSDGGTTHGWQKSEYTTAGGGFIRTTKYDVKRGEAAVYVLTVDKRDPERVLVELESFYVAADGDRQHDYLVGFLSPPDSVSIVQAYLSHRLSDAGAEWRGFKD